MHSHNRTLLASLGFSDKDKKEARHDLACQYLREKGVLSKILCSGMLDPRNRSEDDPMVPWARFSFEHHITKGQGKYKTTIGFADAIVWPVVMFRKHLLHPDVADVNGPASCCASTSAPAVFASQYRLLVEVKIKPVPVGDILRQLRLYDEYLQIETHGRTLSPDGIKTTLHAEHLPVDSCSCIRDQWVRERDLYESERLRLNKIVITDYPVTNTDLEVLRSIRAHHVQLGPSFNDFVDNQTTASSLEI